MATRSREGGTWTLQLERGLLACAVLALLLLGGVRGVEAGGTEPADLPAQASPPPAPPAPAARTAGAPTGLGTGAPVAVGTWVSEGPSPTNNGQCEGIVNNPVVGAVIGGLYSAVRGRLLLDTRAPLFCHWHRIGFSAWHIFLGEAYSQPQGSYNEEKYETKPLQMRRQGMWGRFPGL